MAQLKTPISSPTPPSGGGVATDASNRKYRSYEEKLEEYKRLHEELNLTIEGVAGGKPIMKNEDGEAVPLTKKNSNRKRKLENMVPLTVQDIERGSIFYQKYSDWLLDDYHARYHLEDTNNWISVLLHNQPKSTKYHEIHLVETSIPLIQFKGVNILTKRLPDGSEQVYYENDVETEMVTIQLATTDGTDEYNIATRHVLPKAVVKRIMLIRNMTKKLKNSHVVEFGNNNSDLSYSAFISAAEGRRAVDDLSKTKKRKLALWETPSEMQVIKDNILSSFYGVILCYETYGYEGTTEYTNIDAYLFDELFENVPTWEG